MSNDEERNEDGRKKLKLGERKTDPQDIAVPGGYAVQVVAEKLNFPTAATFDDQGNLYVIEAGFTYKPEWETPQLIRLDANDNKTVIAHGERNGPWDGITFYKDNFYIAEGGTKKRLKNHSYFNGRKNNACS